MAKIYVRDRKGVLEEAATKVIHDVKRFKILRKIKILYIWRLGETPRFDDENRMIAAQTRLLPKRERDIYGYDVEIEVFKQSWRRRGPKSQYRLMWHELTHIDIQQGENFKIDHDDDGRVIIKIREHDITVTTFEDEIKKFGLSPRDVSDATILAKALKKRKKENK